MKCVFMLFLIASGAVAAETFSDVRIKELIIDSNSFIDNPEYARATFLNAKSCCGADTNRFARLLYEVAQANSIRVVEGVVEKLGRYGTSAQLPFLYSMTTNAELGATAMRSVLRLEGLTERSVSAASNFLFRTSIDQYDRSEFCGEFASKVFALPTDNALRRFGLGIALGYAATANQCFRRLDESLVRTDPSYGMSRRRLAVLRSVAGLGVNVYQAAYVTNAIAELVAYPEVDLPE